MSRYLGFAGPFGSTPALLVFPVSFMVLQRFSPSSCAADQRLRGAAGGAGGGGGGGGPRSRRPDVGRGVRAEASNEFRLGMCAWVLLFYL